MQRQSLGSPASKLHSHGVLCVDKNDAAATTTLLSNVSLIAHTDDDDHKASKPRRFSSSALSPSSASSSISTVSFSISSVKPEKLIHVIPLLTLLCFLVLYLVSHNPTQSELAHFSGVLELSSNHLDSTEDSDVTGLAELRRGDVLAIRSFRNLQEITETRAAPKSRFHRKFADF